MHTEVTKLTCGVLRGERRRIHRVAANGLSTLSGYVRSEQLLIAGTCPVGANSVAWVLMLKLL